MDRPAQREFTAPPQRGGYGGRGGDRHALFASYKSLSVCASHVSGQGNSTSMLYERKFSNVGLAQAADG